MNIFKQFFARFLSSRRTGHLFRRRTILESLPKEGRSGAPPEPLHPQLLKAAQSELAAVLAQLNTRKEGLSDNEAGHEKPMPWWVHLWLSYKNPFNLLLTVLAAVSWLTDDLKAATVIGSMVGISTVLRFVQERRSNQAAEALKELVSNKATVIRQTVNAETGWITKPSEPVDIPIKLLVPGDIVKLSAGDMIPADCRVMVAKDLFVSQSAMTGESLPVEKFPETKALVESVLEMTNLVFMGTNVVSGSATVVVLATGNHTYFGTLATRVTSPNRDVNAFPSSWCRLFCSSMALPRAIGRKRSCSPCRSPSG